jgi:hypothetical protein
MDALFENIKHSGRSISRILSSGKPRKRGCSACAVISLGSASPRCSVQPTRGWPFPQEGKAHAETSSLPSSTDDFAPAWPCSRRGLPGHLHYGKRRWSLTPPFHHHHFTQKDGRAVCFCGPCPAGSRPSAVSPPRLLSDAVLHGVRTFLDPDNAGPRLPDQPESIA